MSIETLETGRDAVTPLPRLAIFRPLRRRLLPVGIANLCQSSSISPRCNHIQRLGSGVSPVPAPVSSSAVLSFCHASRDNRPRSMRRTIGCNPPGSWASSTLGAANLASQMSTRRLYRASWAPSHLSTSRRDQDRGARDSTEPWQPTQNYCFTKLNPVI